MAMRSGPFRPGTGPGPLLHVTPATAGWRTLEFAVVDVRPDVPHHGRSDDRETVIVTLSGAGTINGGGVTADVRRSSVFEEVGKVVYLPPGTDYTVESSQQLVVAIGSAPAQGLLPARCIEPWEMRTEIRGGGQSHRQVVHTLSHPLPAERLIVYEVYVPRGTWAGWPPHRHDGVDGSPYLEETYYFRLDRPEGYVLHRNFCDGTGPDASGADADFDEVAVAGDGDVVCVPMGYHTSVVSPGSNMYFLNFLAGDLLLDERVTPPCFHADHTWITDDWEAGAWGLPVVRLPQPGDA
jgi:5-deoxy-glucuronate isomerase